MEYHGMSGEPLEKILLEVFSMCNNVFGSNNCWWIIILVLLFCCGCGNQGNNCDCGCNNGCG